MISTHIPTPIGSAESFSLLKHYLFFFNPTHCYQQEPANILFTNAVCGLASLVYRPILHISCTFERVLAPEPKPRAL